MHNENPVTDALMDKAGLVAALFVSIVMLLVMFGSIAPDVPTRIGMWSLSFIVGFFGVRGWLSRDDKGNRVPVGVALCIVFATVEVFSHTSFILISTNIQAKAANVAVATYEDDPEYKRLVKNAEDLKASATALAGTVAGMREGFRTEVDIRQGGVESATEQARIASEAVSAYVKEWKSEAKAESAGDWFVKIDANAFFTAIPDAITSENPARWIALAFSVLIFTGVQLTVLITADGAVRSITRRREAEIEAERAKQAEAALIEESKKPKTGRAPGVVRSIPKKVVYAWVQVLWSEHSKGASDKIVNRNAAIKFLNEKSIPITKLHDEKLFTAAVKLGIIEESGVIKKTALEAKKALDEAQKRK